MIKRLITFTFLLLLGGAIAAHAAPTLTIIPGNGALIGAPGTTVGWDFSLYNDSATYNLYVNVVYADGSLAAGAFPNGLGDFADAIAIWSLGSLVLAPHQTFTGTMADGHPLATFAISLNAPLSAVPVSGNINVLWEQNSGGPEYNYYDSGVLSALASVTTVPEPSAYILLFLSLGVVGYARKKMKHQV